jgi:hypothetical protein
MVISKKQQVLDRMNLDYNAYEEVRRDQYRGVSGPNKWCRKWHKPQYRDKLQRNKNMYREPIRQPQYEDQINYGSYMRNDYNNQNHVASQLLPTINLQLFRTTKKPSIFLPTQIAKEVRSEKNACRYFNATWYCRSCF